jgi:hypothetical protein
MSERLVRPGIVMRYETGRDQRERDHGVTTASTGRSARATERGGVGGEGLGRGEERRANVAGPAGGREGALGMGSDAVVEPEPWGDGAAGAVCGVGVPTPQSPSRSVKSFGWITSTFPLSTQFWTF